MTEGRVGTVIAQKYRLDEELGRGGMGAVYRAFHLRVHKVFALKMLLGDIARHRSIVSRFQLEAQAAGRIGHPGILDVYDVGEDADGAPFIVMELLRGEPLSVLVRRERLEVEAALWVAIEVLDVLEAAHKAGIIHRDVKPQNVFLTSTGPDDAPVRGVKLLDFGIAKFSAPDVSALTRSGEIIGSPLYMAPEQAKGEPDVDERVDVWSVGAMLFEMLTGHCAHTASTPVAVLAKILTEPAPPPSSRGGEKNPELDQVVQKALSINRAERWASAREMRDALVALRKTKGVPALPAPVKPSLPPKSTDATPAAITSTIAAPSTPPPSGLEPTEPAIAYEPPAKTRLETPAAKAEPKRTPVLPILAIAGMLGAAVYVATRSAPPTPPQVDMSTNAATPPSAPASAPPQVDMSTNAAARASGDPPPAASSVQVDMSTKPAAAPSASARPARAQTITAPSASTGPRCAAREHVSQGHCCELGLEWQTNHCERPIATSF